MKSNDIIEIKIETAVKANIPDIIPIGNSRLVMAISTNAISVQSSANLNALISNSLRKTLANSQNIELIINDNIKVIIINTKNTSLLKYRETHNALLMGKI
jgi:hypothetical protein